MLRAAQLANSSPRQNHFHPRVERLEDRATPTILVTNTNDNGAGSLRDAITQANLNGGDDIVLQTPQVVGKGIAMVPLAGTITLNTELPTIGDRVTIWGSTPDKLTVTRSSAQGTPQFSIFTIGANSRVGIDGLSITGGDTTGNGGGIDDGGTLTVSDCWVYDNTAALDGGGIYGGGDSLTVDNCQVYLNQGRLGGGILGGTMLTVTNGTDIFANAASEGGGVYCQSANIDTTEIFGNTATLDGGGIDSQTSVSLCGVEVSDNNAGRDGGGIFMTGTGDIASSEINGNEAGGDGGGINAFNQCNVTVTDTQVNVNSATGNGGGYYIGIGSVSMSGGSLDNNTAGSGDAIYYLRATATYSLSNVNPCTGTIIGA
jgi:hypothetical protein